MVGWFQTNGRIKDKMSDGFRQIIGWKRQDVGWGLSQSSAIGRRGHAKLGPEVAGEGVGIGKTAGLTYLLNGKEHIACVRSTSYVSTKQFIPPFIGRTNAVRFNADARGASLQIIRLALAHAEKTSEYAANKQRRIGQMKRISAAVIRQPYNPDHYR